MSSFCTENCKVLTLHLSYFRFKGAREITPGARHFMFAEGDTYTLIINNIYSVDADEYVCRAVNKGGVKSTRAELIIMSKLIQIVHVITEFVF